MDRIDQSSTDMSIFHLARDSSRPWLGHREPSPQACVFFFVSPPSFMSSFVGHLSYYSNKTHIRSHYSIVPITVYTVSLAFENRS